MPSESIKTPTRFADWKATRALFDDVLDDDTQTYVVEAPRDDITAAPGGATTDAAAARGSSTLPSRHAYGRTAKGFCFFISMTRDEELEFCQLYFAWRHKTKNGTHGFISAGIGSKPPSCGTPNTPKCVANLCGANDGCLVSGARSVRKRDQAA